MTTQKIQTLVAQTKINRLNQTQFDNATTIENNELYAVDPQFNGGKVLATDSNGDIVESTVAPANIGTVKTVNNTSPDSNGNVAITIPTVNNASLTITQGGTTKGTFTANASSNVTVNLDGNQRNICEIVQSTIPLTDAGLHLLDGALINGNGIYSDFVDYIADLYDNATDKYSNVIKVGSLTDNNGVLSGFSTSNYAKLPLPFQPSSNTWEMVWKITTGASVTGETNIISNYSDDGFKCPIIQVYNAKFRLLLSSNGTSWDLSATSGTNTVLTNTDYYLKLIFDGSKYVLSYSTDGTNYIVDITISSSTTIHQSSYPLWLGTNGTASYNFAGSIDLNESYININGSRWWDGRLPYCFTNEVKWQSSVTTYGVCGKFVYDSVNNTVRLPKITGFTEGTIDPTTLGDLTEAGLPNITGDTMLAPTPSNPTGCFYTKGNNTSSAYNNIISSVTICSDASRSSSIYGNSNTVQPQSIKVLYYIVIATSTKTEIQVDIDEIATDLNGKADVDLTNCTKPHITETYVNGTSWYRVYSDGWCEQGGVCRSNLSTNLLKTYTDTNYTLVGIQRGVYSSDAGSIGIEITRQNTSNFAISFRWNGSWVSNAIDINWQASGYIR